MTQFRENKSADQHITRTELHELLKPEICEYPLCFAYAELSTVRIIRSKQFRRRTDGSSVSAKAGSQL
nr:unnamed protein product [Haemonchus contortus]